MFIVSQMDAWSWIGEYLKAKGVEYVFGLPSDDLVSLFAFENAGIEFIVSSDQRHSAYQAVASVQAKISDIGVVVLGRGPAVTHAMTGILEAQAQRTPLLVLTSGVSSRERWRGYFQELDASLVISSLVKRSTVLTTLGELHDVLDALLSEALCAPRGPVHLEIPEFLALGGSVERVIESSNVVPVRMLASRRESAPDISLKNGLRQFVRRSRRPAVLLGGGSKRASNLGALQSWCESWGVPLLVSASGRGAVNEDSSVYLGLAGLYMEPGVREWLGRIDVLLCLGSRLEETVRDGLESSGTHVIQVIDSILDAGGLERAEVVVADVDMAIEFVCDEAPGCVDDSWGNESRDVRRAATEALDKHPSDLKRILRSISECAPCDAISVHENGLQDIWSYYPDVWRIPAEGDSLAPSEQTPLGYGASAAVGLARVQCSPVVAVVGDSAFRTLGSEWRCLSDLRSPLLFVVLDNGGMGWLQANLNLNGPCDWKRRELFCGDRVGLCDFAHSLGLDVFEGVWGESSCHTAVELWKAVASAHQRGRGVMARVVVDLLDAPPGFEYLSGHVVMREEAV